MSVYIIQNLITGKVYVGKTSQSLVSRFNNGHLPQLKKNVHSNTHLQNAWNKDGENSFEFYLLDEYNTESEMNTAEIFYIFWYKQLGLCYNLRSGGEGGSHSEETCKKISQSHIGSTLSETTKQKLRDFNLGRKDSEETCKKRSDYNKSIGKRPPLVFGIDHPMYGKKHSEEAKKKMSEARSKRFGYKRGGKEYEAFGESKTISQWSHDSRCTVTKATLSIRLKRGWTIERAMIKHLID